MSAISALEGPEEGKVVSQLLQLRDELSGLKKGDRAEGVERLRGETMAAVNDYFQRRLTALPEIAEYLERVSKSNGRH
jgi:hypothetical protein